MTTITTQQENTIINTVAATLVREELCTPKQALATATVFSANIHNLLTSSEEWVFQMSNMLDDALVDGQPLDVYPALDALVRAGFVEYLLGTKVLVATKATVEMIDAVKTSYAPLLASDGIVERKRGYARTKTSPLFKEAVHALESTQYMASHWMLDIAREVYKLATPEQREQLMKEDYVLKGTAAMEKGEAYVSEFFGDLRGRLYQASCFGPNGQSSDMARALMDLHGVSRDYDDKEVMDLLIAEMHDMGDFEDDQLLIDDAKWAMNNPASFVVNHLDKLNHINKPWNFVKFAHLLHDVIEGKKPYIGVAVGLDAKCSGPQLGACMVGDQRMLAATGFSMQQVKDAYHNAITEVEKAGITGLTRTLVKKPFMAIFYGAGMAAMLDEDTITPKTYFALYDGLSIEQMEEKSEKFYKAILKSFGPELNKVRTAMKQAGYDYEMDTAKYSKPVRHSMPDGFEVAMEYKVKLDINGDLIEKDSAPTKTHIESGFISKTFDNMVFTTKEYNLGDYARTGFVNMIQATDALLARLIVVHANRLGAQHIISVHDCFRVNIHDMMILKQAIKNAYLDLFSKMKNQGTVDLPLGTDILGLYFDGSMEATKEEYKPLAPHYSQFFKNGTRTLRAVNGVRFAELVNSLGATYYFDK